MRRALGCRHQVFQFFVEVTVVKEGYLTTLGAFLGRTTTSLQTDSGSSCSDGWNAASPGGKAKINQP